MQDVGPRRVSGDPYRVLGVSAEASPRDIARAYRRAVQHAHPDARPHDRQAAARFRALTEAYDLLRDPGRRADYDRGHRFRRPSGQPPPQPGAAPAKAASPDATLARLVVAAGLAAWPADLDRAGPG